MSGPNTEAQLPLYAIRSGMQSIANVAQLAVDQKLLAVDFGALISRKIDRLRQDWQLCDDHGDDKIDRYERPSYDDAPADGEAAGGEGSDAKAKAKASKTSEPKVKKAATSKKTAGADAKLEKDQKKPKFSTDACRFVLRDANYIQKLRELAGVHQVLVRRALTLLNARHRAMAGNFERFVRLRNVAASEPERLTLSGMKRTLLEKYSHILEAEGHATSDQGELGAEDYPSLDESEGRRNLDPQQGGNHVRLTTDEQELLDRVLPVAERSPLHFSKATRVKKKAHPEYDVNMENGGGLFYKTVVDDGDGFDLDHGEEPPPKPPPGLKGEAGKIFL